MPNEQVVEVMEFETTDPKMQSEMTATFTLTDAAAGSTDVLAIYDNLPPGLPPADNETGWRCRLTNLQRSSRRGSQRFCLPPVFRLANV